METVTKWAIRGTNALMRQFTRLPSEPIPKQQHDLLEHELEPGEVGYAYKGGPAIAKLTPANEKDFNKKRTSPIMTKLLGALPRALVRAYKNPHPCALTDEQFAHIIDTTPYCLTTRPVKDNPKQLVIDVKHMRDLPTFRGMYTMGAKVFVNAETCMPCKIMLYPSDHSCKAFAVRPCDKAWPYAMLLAMHALNHVISLGQHPLLHFPMNVIATFAQQDLCVDNPVRHLLAPHIRFTLGINDSVLNHENSILTNHNNFASPFDCRAIDIYKMHFIPSWRAFNFAESAAGYPQQFRYGRMMQHYRDVIEEWVDSYFDQAHLEPRHWREVEQWFEHVACHLDGWWGCVTPSTLRAALTSILIKVTVEHSSHHHLYSQIPAYAKPWRWRTRVPEHAQDDCIDIHKIQWRVDRVQEEVAGLTFFGVNPAALLRDVRYYDECGKLICMDYKQFRSDLQEIERCYPSVPLKVIAQSIDY